MRILFRLCGGCSICIALNMSVYADNAELMKKHAEHVLEVNRSVLEKLPELPNNSKIKLSADVVQVNGHTEIKVQSIDISPLPTKKKSDTEAVREENIELTGTKGSSFVRYTQYSDLPKPEPKTKTGNSTQLTEDTGGVAALSKFLDAHPNLKAKQLGKDALNRLALEDLPSSGTALLIWED